MPKIKAVLIFLVVLAASLAAVMFLLPKEQVKTAQENAKALIGGPFSLINHHGEKVTNETFKGKYMLIYFGYTYCPDICPMELQTMANALNLVPEKILNEINPIFISVDPDRDTTHILAQYVPAFHPRLIGLNGSLEQITTAKKAYRVYSANEKPTDDSDPDSYLVSHTSYTYLMDRNGEYVTHFKTQTDPAMMAKRLEEIIGQE